MLIMLAAFHIPGNEQTIRCCFVSRDVTEMSSAGHRTIGRSQNPSINTEVDGDPMGNGQTGALKVEDGIKNLFILGVRPPSALINDETALGHNRSSTSFFSLQPVYFNLLQIFEHLGNDV